MKQAAEILEFFKVPYELTIVSAHRTPKRLYEFAQTAVRKGLKIIVAGAGGAAHLPGMVASITTLPVIGVPVQSKSMKGIDSLYSIVQMPPGIPVATVAINGAMNAGLLAVEILSLSDKKLLKKLTKYKSNLEHSVVKKAKKLEKLGYTQYLDESNKNSQS